MSTERKQLGDRGEKIARDYLISRGWGILETNFRCRFGEIDIVARDGETLVFVEVRTRSSRICGTPEESVNHWKKQRLYKLARVYLGRLGREVACRFDVIALYVEPGKCKLRHLQSVF